MTLPPRKRSRDEPPGDEAARGRISGDETPGAEPAGGQRPLGVLVVDDEPLARRRLVRMLRRLPDCTVLGEAADATEALDAVRAHPPDVVLLDIRMPGRDGLDLARELEGGPAVIFTTAYDAHAVEAFETSAVDYLLKPIEADRLQRALERVRRRRRPAQPGDTGGAGSPTLALTPQLETLLQRLAAQETPTAPTRISARAGNTLRVFDPRDISRFHAADRYTVFHHDGREYVLDDSLTALEVRLEPLGFVRVHRSELVQLAHVEALRLEEGATAVVLRDGQVAPVSRRALPGLKRRLGLQSD